MSKFNIKQGDMITICDKDTLLREREVTDQAILDLAETELTVDKVTFVDPDLAQYECNLQGLLLGTLIMDNDIALVNGKEPEVIE